MKPQLFKIRLALLALCISGFYGVSAQCYELYGVTFEGGEFNAGTIFKTDGNGDNLTNVFSLYKDQGLNPTADLCKLLNGKLFGMTPNGGKHEHGILFEFDTVTNSLEIKFHFDGIESGSSPNGSVIQAANGKLYGLTTYGGANNLGVLFEYDPVINTYTKKFDFSGKGNGSKPIGSLMQANNGKLYGMTTYGGEYDKGVLFEWDPEMNIYTKKIDFNGEGNGRNPRGSLMQADDGKIYGMTPSGGTSGAGTIFEWDPATDNLTKKLDFNREKDGYIPYGSLIQADNGKLYGMTCSGGIIGLDGGLGTLFEWDPKTNTYINKLNFNPETGYNPNGSLMKGVNGKLYGMTTYGGENDKGVLFEWDPAKDTYTKMTDFDIGLNPYGSLVQLDNGKLYGMTKKGGSNNAGIIFEWDPNTAIMTNKFTFIKAVNGCNPFGSLILADNDKLYGMTLSGGDYDLGVLFEWDPVNKVYTKKLDFNGKNGSFPYCSLMKADNGKLYGMTTHKGVIFEWDPFTDTYIKKHDVMGHPEGSLVQADNGKFYGMSYDPPVLFEWDLITNIYTQKFVFNYAQIENGIKPRGLLVQDDNGKLYGMTTYGGVNNKGVLFEWDPATDTFTKKLDFNGEGNGSYPYSTLMKTSNGKLYGVTALGGKNDDGVIFEWNPYSDTYTKKFDFNFIDGSYPLGPMMQADNGKLYGLTKSGGIYNLGVLFEWDPVTNIYIKKFDLNKNVGGSPWTSCVTAIKYSTSRTLSAEACDTYISPSGKVWVESGVYTDTIQTITGCDSVITINLTIQNSVASNIDPTACESFASPSGKYLWTTSGEYKGTIRTISGCDSIISVNLTIISIDNSVTENAETLVANATDATYQWVDCDNNYKPIDGEINRDFCPVNDGNYAVVISQNECTDTSSCFSFIKTGLLTTNFKHKINIYPNPTNGSFFIDMGLVYPSAEISICELNGSIIRKNMVFKKRIIDMELSEVSGIYMVVIKAGNNMATFKILKK